MITPAK